jgi:hypothetical protein
MRFELPDPTHLSAETVRQRYEEVHLKACERAGQILPYFGVWS